MVPLAASAFRKNCGRSTTTRVVNLSAPNCPLARSRKITRNKSGESYQHPTALRWRVLLPLGAGGAENEFVLPSHFLDCPLTYNDVMNFCWLRWLHFGKSADCVNPAFRGWLH